MVDEATGVKLTFNGEIYNYIELRKELEVLGHCFQSKSDTEVLLRSYLAWGEQCVERFNGDWAFLIWDPRNRKAFFSRDRFSVKPLYYTLARGVLSISSEPKALLLLYPELRKVNEKVLFRFLRESALYDSNDSFYDGINLLQSSHSGLYSPDENALSISRYWDWPTTSLNLQDDIQAQFNFIFEDAVRLRMRSDVPIGLTLSGGLDSTAVMAIADKCLVNSTSPIKAYTAVYKGNSDDAVDDEQAWAALASAECPNVNHTLVVSTVKEWLQTLRKCIWHMDGPGYSPAVFPQWNITRTSSMDGVKVILEGQGADELLGGYTDYAAATFIERMRPSIRKFNLSSFCKEMLQYYATFGASFFMRLARLISPRLKNFNYRYFGLMGVMRNDFIERVDPYSQNLSAMQNKSSVSLAEKLMRHDFMTSVLPGLLHYGDAISMANGIESRLPFLDYRLVEFCSRLPIEWKIRDGKTKFILREYLRVNGQVEIANRQDKKGYPTPLESFFKQNNGEMLREILLSPEAKIHDYCDAKKIKKLINRYLAGLKICENPLYRLLSAELWLRECIA